MVNNYILVVGQIVNWFFLLVPYLLVTVILLNSICPILKVIENISIFLNLDLYK